MLKEIIVGKKRRSSGILFQVLGPTCLMENLRESVREKKLVYPIETSIIGPTDILIPVSHVQQGNSKKSVGLLAW